MSFNVSTGVNMNRSHNCNHIAVSHMFNYMAQELFLINVMISSKRGVFNIVSIYGRVVFSVQHLETFKVSQWVLLVLTSTGIDMVASDETTIRFIKFQQSFKKKDEQNMIRQLFHSLYSCICNACNGIGQHARMNCFVL